MSLKYNEESQGCLSSSNLQCRRFGRESVSYSPTNWPESFDLIRDLANRASRDWDQNTYSVRLSSVALSPLSVAGASVGLPRSSLLFCVSISTNMRRNCAWAFTRDLSGQRSGSGQSNVSFPAGHSLSRRPLALPGTEVWSRLVVFSPNSRTNETISNVMALCGFRNQPLLIPCTTRHLFFRATAFETQIPVLNFHKYRPFEFSHCTYDSHRETRQQNGSFARSSLSLVGPWCQYKFEPSVLAKI